MISYLAPRLFVAATLVGILAIPRLAPTTGAKMDDGTLKIEFRTRERVPTGGPRR